MTSSSDSMNFEINNQQGVPDNEGEDSPIESQMTEEMSNVRARGQESQPQEEVTLRALMDFMRTPVSYTHLDVYKRQGCCLEGPGLCYPQQEEIS